MDKALKIMFLLMSIFVLNASNVNWNNKLIEAIESNGFIETKRALDNGANIESIDKDKWPALQLAIDKGNEKIVKLLLRSGADIYSKNRIGWTASDVAYWANQKNILNIITLLEKLNYLASSSYWYKLGKHKYNIKSYLIKSKLTYDQLISKRILSEIDNNKYTKLALEFLEKQKYLDELPSELKELVEFNRKINLLNGSSPSELEKNFSVVNKNLKSIYYDYNSDINKILKEFNLINYKNHDLNKAISVYMLNQVKGLPFELINNILFKFS